MRAAARPPLLPALGTRLRRRLKAPGLTFAPAAAPPQGRQLLVDVSVIVRGDAGTGIQRVVRALTGELIAAELPGVIVQPVFASRAHGYCRAELDAGGRVVAAGGETGVLHPVTARPGDIFLGLDLAAHLLPHTEADLARWRAGGVRMAFLVYDLLPLERPEWFAPRTVRNFERWLGVLARQADCCVCISQTVADGFAAHLAQTSPAAAPDIAVIPLGADMAASFPSAGLPANIAEVRHWVRQHRAVLAIGTVEPRKGHEQLLAAFAHHWQAEPGSPIALLIAGRPGWKTEAMQAAIRQHPEQGRRLMWLDAASDELLGELYRSAAGLIAASHGEGFGLPLIEALAHGLPVLARDLPVFREVGGARFAYFADDRPAALAGAITAWLDAPRPPAADAAALARWQDSAAALARILGLAPAACAEEAAQ